MATRTPGIQNRSQYGSYWGQYASAAALPNASGNPLANPYFAQLEAGDIAFVMGTGVLYVCTSAGTLGGGDAVWAAVGSGSTPVETVLWEWNQTDVTQFGASIPYGGGNVGTITPSVVAQGSGSAIPNPLLRLTLAGATGPVILPINTGISLPRRYAVEYTMRTTLGLSTRDFGFVFFANAGFTYGFAIMSDLSATNRRGYRVEAGAWSTSINFAALTQGAEQQRRMEFTASADPNAPGVGGPGEWRMFERREQSSFSANVNSSPGTAMAFGDWTGQGPCNQIGIAFANAAANEVVDIEDLRIVSLP